MVALDQDLVISALEIVSPLFHCVDDCQELPNVRVVVSFAGRAFSRVEIDLAKNPKFVILVEDAGDCQAAYIGLQNDRFLRVEVLQDRCVGNGLSQLSKCGFGIPRSPFPPP